jgi:hypothetical protein
MAGELRDPDAMEDVPVVAAQELRCPNCGAPWTMRGFNTTQTFACASCGGVIDTSGEKWQLVQKVEGAYQTRPRFALGTRGKLEGITWEVIGWCARYVRAYGQKFSWEEHLLYNPYEGFRYLIYQDGHFVLAEPLAGLPSVRPMSASYEGESYKHFSTGNACVEEVLGEFPWQVRRNDIARADDFVSPPYMLSREETEDEITWSRSRYLSQDEALAFAKPSRQLGSAKGIHPCQPNPHKANLVWIAKTAAASLVAWALLAFIYLGSCKGHEVWRGTVPPEGVTEEVTLEDGGVLEVHGNAGCNNNWVYLNVMLVGPQGVSETAHAGGVEMEFYSGADSDGPWSEGNRGSSELMGGIPSGKYVLQLTHHPGSTYKGSVSVRLVEDVAAYRYVCCSLLLLLVVPCAALALSASFEQRRWAESDHA